MLAARPGVQPLRIAGGPRRARWYTPPMPDRFLITAPADSGNIDVLDASDPAAIRLRIREDGKAPFHQWFYFRVAGAAGTPLTLKIENAGSASYVPGWTDYRAVTCEDGVTWPRVPTTYEDGVLTIRFTPSQDVAWVAYFAPYGFNRAQILLAETLASPLAMLVPLGTSVDGQPLDRVTVGGGPLKLWVIGRQHPGESMGSWWMDGFLPRLVDQDDPVAASLREKATVHVVPMMNPDGVARGHLRTNAAGTDLNRAWAEPDEATSPEVFCVRREMEALGCDFFLDVHGDEAIPNNFIAGAEGIPVWGDRLQGLQDRFKSALLDATPDFQTKDGYPIPAPGKANPKIATNWVSQRFDCLGMTLEMPFKDAAVNPDQAYGWSPERCKQLGRDCLTAIEAVVPHLR